MRCLRNAKLGLPGYRGMETLSITCLQRFALFVPRADHPHVLLRNALRVSLSS